MIFARLLWLGEGVWRRSGAAVFWTPYGLVGAQRWSARGVSVCRCPAREWAEAYQPTQKDSGHPKVA
jgi:hypothetical protein